MPSSSMWLTISPISSMWPTTAINGPSPLPSTSATLDPRTSPSTLVAKALAASRQTRAAVPSRPDGAGAVSRARRTSGIGTAGNTTVAPMGHDHHHHGVSADADRRRLAIALAILLVFALGEGVGGPLSGAGGPPAHARPRTSRAAGPGPSGRGLLRAPRAP